MLHPTEVLKITENEIHTKYDCSIELDLDNYKEEEILETSDSYIIPGIFDIYFEELNDYTSVIIDYNISLVKPSNITEDRNTVTLSYNKDDLIAHQDKYQNVSNIGFIIRLLEGRAKFIKSDPLLLLNILHKHLSNIDLVHLELIISNMFRCADDESVKCRIKGNYDNSILVGQTQQPFTDSWLSAMTFQFIKKGIHSGIVSGKDIQNNPIEKIINQDFKNL